MSAERQTIAEVGVLVEAIFAGDLLGALPPDAIDRERHQAGIALLEVARDRLRAILGEQEQEVEIGER